MIFKKKSEGGLLYRIITGNKWDRNDKIRKVSFTTINVIVDSDRIITDAQMAEELSGSRIFTDPKVQPIYYLSITKGENNFTMETYVRYHLNEVVRLSSGPLEVMK